MKGAWEAPLGNPPKVAAMGRNAHGFVPRDSYCLPDLWSLHLFGYDAILKLGDEEHIIRPGSMGITPPGVTISTQYFGISVHLFAHFSLPPGPCQTVPAICDTGPLYEAIYADFYGAVQRFPREPGCASAFVWSALWKSISIGGLEEDGNQGAHRAVRRACEVIEQNLSSRIVVSGLAEEAEVSPSYLARLFQESCGESVVSFIRRRRMERASDLLRHSNLPIKLVASSVGFTDLQQFNKAVRGFFGASPRAMRQTGQGIRSG